MALDSPVLDRRLGGTLEPGAALGPAEQSGSGPPRRRPGLLRSAGVRFAIVYALLFGISAFALALFLWWATAGLLDRQVDAAIRADTQGLQEQWDDGGLAATILAIRDRLRSDVDDDAIYLLVGPELHRLAGNLEHWPAGVSLRGQWSEIPITREGTRSLARVETTTLGDFHLLVGRDIQMRARLRGLLTDALLWALLVVVVLGSAGALVIRSLFSSTIADVSQTTEAIIAGDLSRRVPLSGRGDEFDRLAETINDMLERIARLMGGVRQVPNALAHDLRTPITRARARLEDAMLHAHGEADLRAAIERAQADLDGIVAVFQALLRIAEIEAGASRSAFATFDLPPLLAGLAELYGAVAEDQAQRLTLRCPPHLAAFGDRDMIQQAVANLLDNAIKFSPPGGEIRLEAADGPDLAITVADRGPGIPVADRARATERFFRGEAARNTPGSGLGLALVQAVATLHGGELILRDNDPGLCCILRLPGPRRSGEPAAPS
jgi:signal transduction histidine kinase